MSDIIPVNPRIKPVNHADSVYYFSHIPKTGGTSFTAILDRFFAVNDIFGPQLWWEVGNIEAVRKKAYRCIRGHFGMGAQALSRQQLQTLTIVRDPLRMAYSTYQYVKREPKTAVHQYLTENRLTFEAFLQDPKTRNLASNRMTKSLSFGLGLLSDQRDLTLTPENYKQCRKQWNKKVKEMAPEKVLEIVKAYLDACFWVGILEEFELSLMMLCHQMSWPPIGATEKLNRHPKEPQISEQAKILAKQMNRFDYALYDHAKASFEGKIKTMFDELNSNAKATEDLSHLIDTQYQKHYIKTNNIPLAEHVEYQFSMPLFGQNWHSREWLETEEAYFRWTGPKRVTTIDFWLKPDDYKVNIEFINHLDDDLLKKSIIKVNGSTVDWDINVNGRAGAILFLCQESYCQQNGLFRLEIITEKLNTHNSVFNTNDNRRVGFAMKSITIQKQEHAGS